MAPITAHLWKAGSGDLLAPANAHGGDMLLGGRAPRAGDVMKMPHLARTFKVLSLSSLSLSPIALSLPLFPLSTCLPLTSFSQTLAEEGKAGFYEGRIAEAIVACVRAHGGVLDLQDLRTHASTLDTPIKTSYRGVDVWEIPPNGQGITALMALNILEGFNLKGKWCAVCLSVCLLFLVCLFVIFCLFVCL